MSKGRPTLVDVARRAGVSRTTASNAYNRPGQLSEAVRTAVLQAAQELGYAGPDPAARQLRTGRSGTVAVLLLDRPGYAFSDPAARLFLDGLAEGLDPVATSLLLVWGAAVDGGPAPAAVRNAVVDGVVSYCVPGDTDALVPVLERGLPLVTVDGPLGVGDACVEVENAAGQAAVTRLLLELGHRRFGIVSMPLRADGFYGLADADRLGQLHDPSSRDRLNAVWAELRAAGVDPAQVPVAVARSSSRAEGRELATRLLTVEDPPTAIIALSDLLGLGCVDAGRELGLAVPGDLSVTGFDGIPDAAEAHPPLTTVAQDHHRKGALAGELLLEMLAGQPARTALLRTSVVPGGSVAPPGRSRA